MSTRLRLAHTAVAASTALATLVACANGAPESTATGTVSGHVLSAPSCPVEVAGSPCPPKPVRGARVAARLGSTEVARTVTGADGSFALTLVEGSYELEATNAGALASTATATVTVRAGANATVTLTVDSGIR